MTTDELDRAGRGEGGAFGVLDPRLTIYALANGMDLAKETTARRLEWYYEGSERGIAIEATDQGTVVITAVPDQILANGVDTTTVTTILLDPGGQAVVGAVVELSVTSTGLPRVTSQSTENEVPRQGRSS